MARRKYPCKNRFTCLPHTMYALLDLENQVVRAQPPSVSGQASTGTNTMRREILICLLLIVTTLAVYWQVTNHEFINYDDNVYVSENPHVQSGLTGEAVSWAFTTTRAGNWHPLTWLSHILDIQLYGLSSRGHHLTSVFLHIANTILLFLTLRWITGSVWRSAFVAGLFALHPLHVESVAWVAERKDVLSTFFWMLTVLAYVSYVRVPRIKNYLLVLAFFTLGLMAKPMLVTLPFILLLLDYWPLKRFQFQPVAGLAESKTGRAPESGGNELPLARLIVEKVPLFILSGISSVITFWAQQRVGALSGLEAVPLKWRIANSLLSYTSYIGKNDMASRSGSILSPSGGQSANLESCISWPFFVGCISGGYSSSRPFSVRSCWLALVSDNSGAGHRSGAGW